MKTNHPEGSVCRLIWQALLIVYVPLILLGPLMGMIGEAYIGVTDPAVNALSEVAYWLSMLFVAVIPAAVAGSEFLRRRGRMWCAWAVRLIPSGWLAAVMLLYTVADGLLAAG